MFCNLSVEQYYKIMYLLQRHQHLSIEDYENMYPFERELYMLMLEDDLKREEEERKRLQNG